ncbi:MAG TPA: acyltransferase [Steroidobacteraceae bacterium]
MRTIEPIQHLRALAALGVVIFHSLGLLGTHLGIVVTHKSLGAAGVDLFFIISGFIMWVTAIDRDERPGTFALKRIVRIVPLYWLFTTFVLALVIIKPSLMRSASQDPVHFLASYLFVAWPHPTMVGRLWPPVIPGWTLNYEMFFYATVTLSLLLERAWRVPAIAAVLVGLPVLGWVSQPEGIASFYTHPILLEFLFGIALGVLFTRGYTLTPRRAWGVTLVALAMFFSLGLLGDDDNRTLMWGVPLAFLVAGALELPALAQGRVRDFSKLLGDASYSLYLVQFVVLPPASAVMIRLVRPWPLPLAATVMVAGLIVVAVVAGIATYYIAERPIMQFARRWIKRS